MAVLCAKAELQNGDLVTIELAEGPEEAMRHAALRSALALFRKVWIQDGDHTVTLKDNLSSPQGAVGNELKTFLVVEHLHVQARSKEEAEEVWGAGGPELDSSANITLVDQPVFMEEVD